MKYLIAILFTAVLLIVTGSAANASPLQKEQMKQEKVDVFPAPVGGMGTLAANIKYPESAKKKSVEGKVLVSALINKAGKVIKTKVVQGLGSGCDEAAVHAIKKTKFTPATKDGKNVECEVTIPVSFKLEK